MDIRELFFWVSLVTTLVLLTTGMYSCYTTTNAFTLGLLVLVSFWRGWVMRERIEELRGEVS